MKSPKILIDFVTALRSAGASVAMTLDDVFLLTAFKAVEEHSVGLSRRDTGNDTA